MEEEEQAGNDDLLAGGDTAEAELIDEANLMDELENESGDDEEADDEEEEEEEDEQCQYEGPNQKRFAAETDTVLKVDKKSIPILAVHGGDMYRKLMGQHYVEMVTALLSPQSTLPGTKLDHVPFASTRLATKIFGLFIVDHRMFLTTIEARLNKKSYDVPFKTCGQCVGYGPRTRQEKDFLFAFTCSPFYLNIFRAAHREAFAYFILYIAFCEHPMNCQRSFGP